MRPIRSLLIYLTVVFLGGALLAPWLYFLMQSAAEHFPALQKIAGNPFHRYVNRSLLVLAVLGLWPLARALGIGNLKDFGLQDRRKWRGLFRGIFNGFCIGFFSLALLALGTILFGTRKWNLDHTTAQWFAHILKTICVAGFVALIEELIFRGTLFGGVRRAHSWKLALILSSAVYAIVHFFEKPLPPPAVEWNTGFFILGRMLRGFVDFQTLVPGFFNLTLAGIILALAFQFSRSLYVSIGIHAGWIFWLKFFGFLTLPLSTSWFWGTEKLIDGWAAAIVLFSVLLVFIFSRKRGKFQSDDD